MNPHPRLPTAPPRVTLDWVVRLLTRTQGLVNLGFAAAVLVGGVIRFPPPTYAPLLGLTGGRVWPYGVLFAISAAGLLAPWYWPRMIGVAAGIVVHSTFSALFLAAILIYPNAGATAWWAYLVFSAQSGVVGGLVWVDNHRRKMAHPGAT